MEESNKKADALVKFLFNNQSISVHLYHTNQSMMVQGILHSNCWGLFALIILLHSNFWGLFLLPLLSVMISYSVKRIKQFNCEVIRILSPGSLSRHNLAWHIGTPNKPNTLKLTRKNAGCNVRGKELNERTNLKIHINTEHESTQYHMSSKLMLANAQSLLEGDSTPVTDEQDVTLEEDSPAVPIPVSVHDLQSPVPVEEGLPPPLPATLETLTENDGFICRKCQLSPPTYRALQTHIYQSHREVNGSPHCLSLCPLSRLSPHTPQIPPPHMLRP